MAKDRDLEIEQDERFQKKSWRYQKIGIVIILLLILTALTGLLGSGP